MKIYCASPLSRGEVIEAMKEFIAGDNNKKKILREKLFGSDFLAGENALKDINVLESFYYLRKNEEYMTLVKHFGSFLLDSGAFTFMSGSHKGTISWDEYVEEYATFINRHKVELFFELDIDSVVGIKEVERLREKLEVLPVTNVDKIIKTELYTAENGYGDFLIIAKRESGRKLMQALYNFALSFEHQKVARNIHNLKPDDFNNK